VPTKTQGERLATLEEQMREALRVLERLDREVHGPGNGGRQSLRQRLHDLSGTVHGLRLALEAEERQRARRSRRWFALVGVAVSVWGVLVPTVALVIAIRGR
jgi:hypothetical protein